MHPSRLFPNLLQRIAMAGAERETRALGGKSQGGCPANSLAGCGDDGNAIAKSGFHRKSVYGQLHLRSRRIAIISPLEGMEQRNEHSRKREVVERPARSPRRHAHGTFESSTRQEVRRGREEHARQIEASQGMYSPTAQS